MGYQVEKNDYLISLQTVGQPHEIFDQEEMNEKTVSEVGITNLHALRIMIVHKIITNGAHLHRSRKENPKESPKSRG